MFDREELAARIYQTLIGVDGLDGDMSHLRDLARRALAAADAFIAVRDAEVPDVFSASIVPRK